MTCHTTKHHAMYTNNILTFNTENSLCLSTQSLKDAATLNFLSNQFYFNRHAKSSNTCPLCHVKHQQQLTVIQPIHIPQKKAVLYCRQCINCTDIVTLSDAADFNPLIYHSIRSTYHSHLKMGLLSNFLLFAFVKSHLIPICIVKISPICSILLSPPDYPV